MRSKQLGVGVILGVLLLAPVELVRGQRQGIALHPHVGGNLDLLEVWVQARMAYAGWPGVSVGIVQDQKLIYAKGFGYADLENKRPTTPDTLYRIASHSKLFTAIAIMQLRDQGKLRLDDPAEKHLKSFPIAVTHPDAHKVTIRHLLTHSSGLPREAGSAYWIDFEFPDRDQVLARLEKQATILPTESLFKYSNLAFALLGEVVAQKTGQSFASYVEEKILAPLEMVHSSVVFPEEHKAMLAVGYGRRMPDGKREAFPFVDARGLAAAAGVTSSVRDMARFVSWQLRLRKQGGRELLAASTLREMQRPHWLIKDWQSGRGLGFGIVHTDERDLIGHGGGYPGYMTGTQISSQENIGVIVFANSIDARPYPGARWSIIDRVFEWIVPAITEASQGKEKESIRPEWKNLVGTYRSIWSDTHILFLDGKMSMVDPNSLDPKKAVVTLEPVAEGTFKMADKLGKNGYGSVGEAVSFDLGPDAKVKRVKIAASYSQPVNYGVPTAH